MLELLAVAAPRTMLAASAVAEAWQAGRWYLLLLLGFSLVVFFHELGHFAVAKWADIRVERFAIGFGPELFGFTRGETRYSFNILPLGGYVRMLGQEDFDTDEEILTSKDPRSFVNKPVGRRMAVVSAGVVMNLILAAFLFMIVYMVGKVETTPVVGFLQAGSPADLAGLQVGDDVKSINGASINSFEQIQMAVVLADPFKPLEIELDRDGQLLFKEIHPKTSEMTQLLQIGIGPAQNTLINYIAPECLEQAGPLPKIADTIVAVEGQPTPADQGQRMWDLLHQRGSSPVTFTVERPDPEDPAAPAKRLDLRVSKEVSFLPNGLDLRSSPRDLLGIIPRARVSVVVPKSAAGVAGLQPGDIITQWGDTPHPDRSEIWQSMKQHAGRSIPIRVRRDYKDHDRVLYYVPRVRLRYGVPLPVGLELEERNGRPVVADVLPDSVAARTGLQRGDVVVRWGNLEQLSAAAIRERLSAGPLRDTLVWIERDGKARSNPLRFMGNLIPDAGLELDGMEQDVLIVASVVPREEFFLRPTAAAATPLSKGCRITAVNGEPLGSWGVLAERFNELAGQTARLSYVPPSGGPEQTLEMDVPESISTLVGLPVMSASAQTINFLLDDKGEVEINVLGMSLELPAYRPEAIVHYLEERVGQDVTVTFQDEAGAIVEKTIHVEPDMIDPWYRRVNFSVPFRTGAVTYINKKTNPLSAVWAGTVQTYYSVAKAYVTFRRMIFTRSVGFEKMSGPIGILHLGSEIAKISFVGMLYFLGFLSANLAVINFLPLPIVDGGLMVFLIIEKIKGSPVSLRVQIATQMLGLALIGTTFLLVTFNDISKFFG